MAWAYFSMAMAWCSFFRPERQAGRFQPSASCGCNSCRRAVRVIRVGKKSHRTDLRVKALAGSAVRTPRGGTSEHDRSTGGICATKPRARRPPATPPRGRGIRVLVRPTSRWLGRAGKNCLREPTISSETIAANGAQTCLCTKGLKQKMCSPGWTWWLTEMGKRSNTICGWLQASMHRNCA